MFESCIISLEGLVLPSGYASVREARRFACASLKSHDLLYLADGVELVVSELVTNALLHAEPPVILSIQEQPLTVLVTVCDRSPTLPAALRPHVMQSSGRGLSIVEAVSATWGSNLTLDGGKSVWASFDKKIP